LGVFCFVHLKFQSFQFSCGFGDFQKKLGEILHMEGGWGLWVSFCELWGVLALFYFLIKI
jgi:hypothetical protein